MDAPLDPLSQLLAGPPLSLTWSASKSHGDLLAIGCVDGRILLRSGPTGTLVGTLEGHTGRVLGVAFSPDGTQLASASDDNTIRLWNPTTGDHTTTLQGHTSRVWGVAFSPDGTQLASASDDGTIRLWDPKAALLEGLLPPTVRGFSGSPSDGPIAQ